MRVCIYGAGAIGGYLGAALAGAGVDVTLIARGPHLAAMRASGLKLLIDGEERISHPRCTDDPAEAGPQDYIIVALKAHSAPAIVAAMQPLFGPGCAVVTAVNGIPWWYFHGLESVDPGGAQWDGIGDVCRRMMAEAQAVGEILGARFAVDIDKRMAGAQAVGAHKTSMLQDLERGRPLEIDALLTVVQELARLTATPSPTIDTVLALIRQRARVAEVY